MRKKASRRRWPPGSARRDLDRWHPLALRRALFRRRLARIAGGGATLVTSSSDELEIARAAWRILAASGGVVDRAEIGRRHGLTRARTHALTLQRHFPNPIAELGQRPLWLTVEVERYFATPRRPGRPRKDEPVA